METLGLIQLLGTALEALIARVGNLEHRYPTALELASSAHRRAIEAEAKAARAEESIVMYLEQARAIDARVTDARAELDMRRAANTASCGKGVPE